MGEHFVIAVMAVEQEGTAFLEAFEEVVAADVGGAGAGDQIGARDEVGGFDRAVRETEVGAGEAEGLLGVVGEIGLRVFVGQMADDLDGGLVRADGTVAAEAVEHAGGRAGGFRGDVFVNLQGEVRDIVFDTDGEAVEAALFEVLIDGEDHGRREVLGGEAVAAADDRDGGVVDGDFDVHVQRFADGAGLFRAVENGDAFDGLRQSGEELIRIERTIQADFDKTVLRAAVGVQIVDGFFNGFAAGTHGDDDVRRVGGADIVEQMILTASHFRELIHLGLDDVADGHIIFVNGFTALEIDVAVLGTDLGDRFFGAHAAGAEFFNGLLVNHLGDGLVRDFFVFVDFVGSTESVKELEERDFGRIGGEVGDESHVQFFLDGVGGQHRETRVAAGHDVRVVAEDGEGLAGEGTGGHVEDGREKFAGDLVHVRNHQEEALGGRVGGGQRASGQHAVDGAGGTCFGLHFDD